MQGQSKVTLGALGALSCPPPPTTQVLSCPAYLTRGVVALLQTATRRSRVCARERETDREVCAHRHIILQKAFMPHGMRALTDHSHCRQKPASTCPFFLGGLSIGKIHRLPAELLQLSRNFLSEQPAKAQIPDKLWGLLIPESELRWPSLPRGSPTTYNVAPLQIRQISSRVRPHGICTCGSREVRRWTAP